MPPFAAPLRLRLDSDALISNWNWLRGQGGSARCGAAIKADGYGLGAAEVLRQLADAGCRDFFVATWAEAAALMPLADGVSLSVLHGVREEDMAIALAGGGARPALSTPDQIARWRGAGGGACDVMIDTGMNRLGLDWCADVSALTRGLDVVTLMSHLASADEDIAFSAVQLGRFVEVTSGLTARQRSLANSAGICLGRDYHFELTRPGLALYGGIPRGEAASHLRQVVTPQAQVLQRRTIRAGDSVGYNGLFIAPRDMDAAILNIGYADGYLRGFSCRGVAVAGEQRLPVLGRVSMDLLIVDASATPELREGDWLSLDYDLPAASAQSGLSQYELLTGLGSRFDRLWV